jgi:hypothetical protein
VAFTILNQETCWKVNMNQRTKGTKKRTQVQDHLRLRRPLKPCRTVLEQVQLIWRIFAKGKKVVVCGVFLDFAT